jgi:ribonuclease P protein component
MKFSEPLKKNYEFRRLYNRGKSAATPHIVMYVRKGHCENRNRLGFTVGTKVGKAVVRNHVRRRLKEIYRLNEEKLKCGLEIVIVARVRSRDAGYAELERDFLILCEKLGIMA